MILLTALILIHLCYMRQRRYRIHWNLLFDKQHTVMGEVVVDHYDTSGNLRGRTRNKKCSARRWLRGAFLQN